MTDLTALSDIQILGLTGAAEARSEFVPEHGWRPAPIGNMTAVMWTPLHRAAADPHRFGHSIGAICLQRGAYSCWNDGRDSNHLWTIEQAAAIAAKRYVTPIVLQCIAVAAQLLAREIADTVDGATHYYSPFSMTPVGRVPAWAIGKTPCAQIGDATTGYQFVFFKGV